MSTQSGKIARKLGANPKDTARKAHRRDPNFAQSRDLREDRGERQMKDTLARQTMPHLTRPG